MTKPFKLRIHLPSFQICRSITSSSLAKSPSSTRGFAPVNAKALDIIYPKSPPPPPSSPNHPSCKRNVASKIVSVESESVESELNTTCVTNSTCNMESPAADGLASTLQKLYNSPEYSAEFDQILWANASSNAERNSRAGSNCVKDQSATSFTASISSADSTGWSSSEDGDDINDDESEDQLSSCSSFDSSSDYDHSVKTPVDHKSAPAHGNESERKNKDGKVRRLKRYVSNTWKDGHKIKLATTSMLPAENSSIKKTVLGRLLPCGVDGKVNESYAIMKKSEDPFDDFKTSMLEMIMEKQISEPEDLEKLLMCFLSLNAKDHHAVIVAAFTEVWEQLYDSSG